MGTDSGDLYFVLVDILNNIRLDGIRLDGMRLDGMDLDGMRLDGMHHAGMRHSGIRPVYMRLVDTCIHLDNILLGELLPYPLLHFRPHHHRDRCCYHCLDNGSSCF